MSIKPGDALIRKKFGFWGNFFQHWALYVSDEEPEVIEKQDIGVRRISFERFHKDMPYTVVPYTGKDARETIVMRAMDQEDDKGFFFLRDNCESFVSYCQTGKIKWSRQILKMGTLAGLLLLLILILC